MKETKKTTKKKTTSKSKKKAPVKKTTAAKNTAPKKTTTPVKKAPAKEEKSTWQKIAPFLIFFLLVGGFLLFYYRNTYIVATVNGQPIYRHELMKEMEKQAGQKTLDGLVTKQLIFQKAAEQKVAVTEEEVTEEITKIEESLMAQGQKLDDVLLLQGLTREDVIEQVRIQKLVDKMVQADGNADTEVSEEEIDAYLEQNKALIPEDIEEAELRETLKAQLAQQKISNSVQMWLEEAQNEAEVVHLLFVQPVPAAPAVIGN